MKFLRNVGLSLLFAVFSALILSFGLLLSAMLLVRDSGNIKEIIRESGVYELPLSKLSVAQASTDKRSDKMAPEVQEALDAAFPPNTVQRSAEQVIDGTHAWLRGATAEPLFRLDFTPQKKIFADTLAAKAESHLSALPDCKNRQLPASSEVFDWTCKPAGVDIQKLAQQTKAEVLASEGLENPIITGQTFKDDEGRPLEEQFANAPQIFQGMQAGVYGIGVLIMLIAALLLLGRKHRMQHLRRIGVTLLSVGIVSYILATLAYSLGHAAARDFAVAHPTEPLTQVGMQLLDQLLLRMAENWSTYALVIGGLGVIILLPLILQRLRHKNKVEASDQSKDAVRIDSSDTPVTHPQDSSSAESEGRRKHTLRGSTQTVEQDHPRPPKPL